MFKNDWDADANRSWWPTLPVETGTRLPSPGEALFRALGAWLASSRLRRSRSALLELTEEQLLDVGLTREEAVREGRRSVHLR